MARRPAETDDQHESPPWMERDRAAPSRRAPDRGGRDRDRAGPNHTVVTWRALIIGAVLAIAVAIAGVIGVRSLIAREPAAVSGGAPGEVPLIRAPAGPYKVKPTPDAAGSGLTGDGMGGTGPATAAPEEPGQASEGRIDSGSLPEAPQRPEHAPTDLLPRGVDEGGDVAPPGAGDTTTTAALKTETTPPARVKAKATPAPNISSDAPPPKPKLKPKFRPAPDQTDAAPAPKFERAANASTDRFELPPEDLARISTVKPAKPAAASGATGTLQLGAFSTREKAEAAWAQFTAAHPALTHLRKRITPLDRDGATLYRLRATGVGDTAHLCATLKAVGEKCLVSP